MSHVHRTGRARSLSAILVTLAVPAFGGCATEQTVVVWEKPGATCEDGKYKVGDSWKDDCNTCQCKEGGKSMCTRMACNDGEAVK